MTVQEPQALQSVLHFHKTFNAYIGQEFSMPSKDVCELRVALLQEELDELKVAIAQGDLVEALDALTDLQYVLSGAVIARWAHPLFADAFAEVQRSNMSKTCKTVEEAEKTQHYYQTERNTPCTIHQKDDVYIVLRDTDNKVLKSVDYSPADLETVIANHT